LFSTGLLQAQSQKAKLHNGYAEKVYLQLDNTAYATNQTIWFKVIVIQAMDNLPTGISKVLHVELIDDEERVIKSKLLELNHGIAENYFEVDAFVKPGKYLLRAYTLWNENFDAAFDFATYITVYPAFNAGGEDAITSIEVSADAAGKSRVTAVFDPKLIDSTKQERIKVYLHSGQKKDSVILRQGEDGRFKLDYELEPSDEMLTMNFITENKESPSKTIELNAREIDLQFLPESGSLVHGQVNKLGFKAVAKDGLGIQVQGEIYDKNNTKITAFKCNELGIGNCSFMAAELSGYYAKILSPVSSSSKKYPLPKAAAQGYNLSVNNVGDMGFCYLKFQEPGQSFYRCQHEGFKIL
tara:strand:- start:1708 stop:2772 length:1065 start_codon:yes stop_codon:yes gene_type:complete